MKGIMVPLLMVMMTGIVVGQQQDSNSFRSTVYRPSPQNGGQGSTDFSSQLNKSDIKPFDFAINDEKIRGIRGGGDLIAKIDPKDQDNKPLPLRVVSGITLVHNNNQNANPPIRKMIGKDAGNGRLLIELDEWALADLKNNKLVYEIPAADRGRYNQVTFSYRSPKPAAVAKSGFGPNSTGPKPDDMTGSSRTQFGPPKQSPFSPLPLPGPEALPGEVNFEGPVIPFLPARNPQVVDNTRRGDFDLNARRDINNQGFGGGQTNPQGIKRQETLAEYQNRILLEKMKQDKIAADLKRQQDFANVRGIDATTNQFGQPALSQQQIDDRLAAIEKQRQIEAYENNLAIREAELARQKRELDNQRFLDSLKVNRNDDIPNFARPTGPVTGTDYPPSGPVLERPARYAARNLDDIIGNPFANGSADPQRQVSNVSPRPTGGVGKYTAAMPGPNRGATNPGNGDSQLNKTAGDKPVATTKNEKRTERFIYFMLLCSLGLNVYLGLISRGFYVRYNELADELRETFTATL